MWFCDELGTYLAFRSYPSLIVTSSVLLAMQLEMAQIHDNKQTFHGNKASAELWNP